MNVPQVQLWPRISRSIAETIYQNEIKNDVIPAPALFHGQMTYGPTGGRVSTTEISEFRESIIELAKRYGFGKRERVGEVGPEFDRAVAKVVREKLNTTWEEAGQSGVWSMISLVFLPDVTHWRWASTSGSSANKERWICIDPTRHTWGRLWWQETMCREQPYLLQKFNESELNQFFERTSFTRHRDLFIYFMEVTAFHLEYMPRRTLVRDVTKRMRRRLAFIDTFSLTAPELKALVNNVVEESVSAIE